MVFEKQGKNGQKRENWSQMIYLVLFFKNQDIKKIKHDFPVGY